MTFALILLLGGLAIFTVWGFVMPRSQWRVLTSWSQRDPGGHEPGAVTIAIHRTVAAIAIAALIFSLMALNGRTENATARPVDRPTSDPVRVLWGSPDPVVVNRVVTPVTQAPADLLSLPLLRYQAIDGHHRDPSYLFNLANFERPHAKKGDGYVGTDPSVGLTALDTSQLVLQMRADERCTPQQVLLLESSTAIVVAVYFGRPVGTALDDAAKAAPCDIEAADSKSVSMLVPIHLATPVGDRSVVGLDGMPIAPAG